MIWKISPLVKFNISSVFIDTLTADEKYPVWDCEDLPFPIQRQLSSKRKTSSIIFVPLLES